MEKELWDKIFSFDLDYPVSEYGFSIRLARENYWTKNFTDTAILEYKKFMYLAATSDLMVSPSEIVDKVWHQHLIFTKFYSDLCDLIGKQIQHVPSTHNRDEYEKFIQAKDRTKKLYISTFGNQPEIIWEYADMCNAKNQVIRFDRAFCLGCVNSSFLPAVKTILFSNGQSIFHNLFSGDLHLYIWFSRGL